MRFLYLDNFRGFDETFIPIRAVNFFVGENSTGKTSVLGIINLLSSIYFWIYQEFNGKEVQFGNFKDMVSVHATDRSFFQVGYFNYAETETSVDDEMDTTKFAFLITFIEEDGLPVASRYYFTRNGKQFKIALSKKRIKYKSEILPRDFEGWRNMFEEWARTQRNDNLGYTYLPKVRLYRRKEALAQIPKLIDMTVRKGEEIQGSSFDIPVFGRHLAWLAPIRSKPRRTYDSYQIEYTPEGEHTPYLIRRTLSKKTSGSKFESFIDKFGRESGLFDSVKINRLGRDNSAPFEVTIILNGMPLRISNVGYGVSQALPILVEMFARPKGSYFVIQQPEVHLHPRAQAAFGDVVFELARVDKKIFFIETHSDFIIDRLRINYRDADSSELPEAQVLFFDRHDSGNKVFEIPITSRGDYDEVQPDSFRSFFIREQMKLLDL